jgi:N-methylhydantoinase A
VEEAAEGIIAIVNENMCGALRLVSVEQGYDPRDFALIGFGGAGPLHGNALSRLINAWPCIIPPGPGVLCAYGDATTRLRNEASQTYVTTTSATSDAEIGGMLRDLAARAAETLEAEGVPRSEQETLWQIDIRYQGQGMKLTVDMSPDDFGRDGLAGVKRRFDAEHEQLFTFALDAPHELVSLRAVVQGGEKPFIGRDYGQGGPDASAAVVQDTRVFADGDWHAAKIYDRAKLLAGNRIPGPAIVTEMDSTALILPGHVGIVDKVGNILIWPENHKDSGHEKAR